MTEYFEIITPTSSRTAWQVETWNFNKLKTHSGVFQDEDGKWKVRIDESQLAKTAEIGNIFNNWTIPPDVDYLGEAILYKSARLTDVISGSHLINAGQSTGWIMNTKTAEIFNQFNCGISNYYPLELIHKKKSIIGYNQFVFDGNGSPNIDYKLSEFVFQEGLVDPVQHSIEINTKFEYEREIDKLRNCYEVGRKLTFKKLVLNSNHNLDLFSFHTTPFLNNYVSESLKNRLEEMNISGIKFKSSFLIKN